MAGGDPASAGTRADPGRATDFPDWLVERLTSAHDAGRTAGKLARALNTPAPLDLRVNTLKAERDGVVARLNAADGIAATPTVRTRRWACASRPSRRCRSIRSIWMAASRCRTRAAQLLGYLLAPKRGEMAVDFCAGAGGKTLLMGALMRSTGRLYAFDVSDKRLARLKDRVAARSGLSNMHPA
jgi:16S rRNA (cytosine967-C5)-methyltransferase